MVKLDLCTRERNICRARNIKTRNIRSVFIFFLDRSVDNTHESSNVISYDTRNREYGARLKNGIAGLICNQRPRFEFYDNVTYFSNGEKGVSILRAISYTYTYIN